jgi:hypothetical protein
MFERQFTSRTVERLSTGAVGKLEELITTFEDPDSVGGRRSFLQELKEDPGPLQLDTLLAEIVKLERVKAIGLLAELFESVSEKSWPGGGLGR